jgi:hypothetical protein
METTSLRLGIEKETEGRDAQDQTHSKLITELDLKFEKLKKELSH